MLKNRKRQETKKTNSIQSTHTYVTHMLIYTSTDDPQINVFLISCHSIIHFQTKFPENVFAKSANTIVNK